MNPRIDFVLNDIDGCFGNFIKPKFYPEKQDLTGYESFFEKLRDFVSANPKVKFAVCTGRSLHLCDNIIYAAGFDGLSVVEMGSVVYDPATKKSILVVEQMKPELSDIARQLKQFINASDNFEPELFAAFPGTGIKKMKDNANMLTYEFLKGTLSAEALYEFLEGKIPTQLKNAIQRGEVKVIPSPTALDIILDIDKGHAVDYVFKKLDRTGKGCLGIGDSSHSDLDMMQGCEFVACPANSDDKLKQYVIGRGGYVASEPFGDGLLEIYHHFFNNNL